MLIRLLENIIFQQSNLYFLTMKVGFLLISSILFFLSLSAQKYDYHWVLGDRSNDSLNTAYGGSDIMFSDTGILEIKYVHRQMPFGLGSSALANKEGTLQFFTNGCLINNAQDELLINGTDLNPGFIAESYCSVGYPGYGNMVSLPHPTLEHIYYLFHIAYNDASVTIADVLYYSIIDMDEERVVIKNQMIINDRFSKNKLEAVKHANGRDWWLMIPQHNSNGFYTFLFDETGISEPFLQYSGAEREERDWNGHAVFSPDGTKYVTHDIFNDLDIYDVDRCTGLLSNSLQIDPMIPFDSLGAGGVSISPNSRFLYLSTPYYIHQYDLEAEDIEASRNVVAVYDGYASIFGSFFFQGQLAPDGRIYLNCANGENVLHVINYPNRKGKACEVVQHGIQLPTYNGFLLPNHPNFRLGALADSPCDTLGLSETPEDIVYTIFPNPARDEIKVELPDFHPFEYLTMTNILGQQLLEQHLAQNKREIRLNVQNFGSGLYFLTLKGKDEKVTEQVLIVR